MAKDREFEEFRRERGLKESRLQLTVYSQFGYLCGYVKCRDTPIARTVEVRDGLNIDVDEYDHLVGVEILLPQFPEDAE